MYEKFASSRLRFTSKVLDILGNEYGSHIKCWIASTILSAFLFVPLVPGKGVQAI